MCQGTLMLAAIGLLVFGAVEFYQTGNALPTIAAGGCASIAFAYAISPRGADQSEASWAWRNPLSTALYIVGSLLIICGAIMVLLNVRF